MKNTQGLLQKPGMTVQDFIKSGRYLEDEVRKRACTGSPHFFDEDTMRFFKSRISELMWTKTIEGYQTEDIYFITSEKGDGFRNMRYWTVRVCDVEGDINTLGRFGEHENLNQARKAIKEAVQV